MSVHEIRCRIEQALHASSCLHTDCVRCHEDIPRPAQLAAQLAADAAMLLVALVRAEAELLALRGPRP